MNKIKFISMNSLWESNLLMQFAAVFIIAIRTRCTIYENAASESSANLYKFLRSS